MGITGSAPPALKVRRRTPSGGQLTPTSDPPSHKAFYPYQDARSVLHACEPPLEPRFPGTRFTAWSQGADWNRVRCAQSISTLFRKVFPTPPEGNTERRLNRTPQSLPRRNASPSTENPQTAYSLRERRRTGHFHGGKTKRKVPRMRFERTTPALGERCSIP